MLLRLFIKGIACFVNSMVFLCLWSLFLCSASLQNFPVERNDYIYFCIMSLCAVTYTSVACNRWSLHEPTGDVNQRHVVRDDAEFLIMMALLHTVHSENVNMEFKDETDTY